MEEELRLIESELSQRWFAVKTGRPATLAEMLEERGVATYMPVETVKRPDGAIRRKPMVPKLLFIHADLADIKAIEFESRSLESKLPPMWVYRSLRGGKIRPIPDAEFRLFRLLTAEETERCEIYRKEEFKIGDRLRVTGGPFAGYEGYARRIRKNKHIVVEIEGLCAIALPFIHPDLLRKC